MAASSYSTAMRRGSPNTWKDLTARVFSFPGMCMVLLATVIFGFCVKQFAEPDIWWHLRTAQDLLQNHSFRSIDTYSFTAAGSPRMNYEWLSEMPYFFAFRAAGLQGILLIYLIVTILIYAGVYYRCCHAGTDCKDATLATLVAIFLGTVSIGPRVLLFGWLCMIALLLVLDRFQRTGKGLWLLPFLFALWINLHGSWVFGAVVFLLTFLAGFVEGQWGSVIAHRWSRPELRKLCLASAASMAALFLNPFGYKLLLYPFDFLFRQQSNVAYVEEWQSVDFSTGNGKLALMLIISSMAAFWLSRRQWRLNDLLIGAFALWVGLSHVRFLFFLGLTLVPMLAPTLKLFTPYERESDKPWLNAGIMAALVCGVGFFFPSTSTLEQRVAEKFPRAALEFIQAQHINGRIFNQYVWGGYMEWKAPELRPFIDGRADIFVYNGVLDDHRRVTTLETPLEILDRYRIDYALLQSDRPLTYLLEQSHAWHPVYSDRIAVLLERTPADTMLPTPPQGNSN